MKVAIVHDSLIEFGGAERVLQSLIKLFPDADLYTSYVDYKLLETHFKDIKLSRLHLSIIHNTPIVGHNSFFQIISPIIWKSFNFNNYDLVITNSAYMLCNLTDNHKNNFIHYINSPPKNLFKLTDKRPIQKIIPYTKILATFYKKSIISSKHLIVNSKHMQILLKNLFNVDSTLIYPPVNIPTNLPRLKRGWYYLIVSRIDVSKHLELAVQACTFLNLQLKIVGKTNYNIYENYLKSIAGPSVEFLGEMTDIQLEELYKSAIAFIFTAKEEDFGIAPVEAMAHGIPVITYYGGGLKETVINKKTGIFYYKDTVSSLISAIQKSINIEFNANEIYIHSKKFDQEIFKKNILNYIKKINPALDN